MFINTEIGLERVSDYHKDKTPIVALHGLNQNPLSLKKLLTDLAQDQFCVYLIHLPGHFADSKKIKSNAKDYLSHTTKAFEIVKNLHQAKPIGFGYSFGGLILTQKINEIPMSHLILMAPALELKPYTFLLKALTPWMKKIRSMPLERKDYEEFYRYYQNGVPVEIYKCFFSIYSDWSKFKNHGELFNKNQTPILIFSHPKDEIVAHRKLKAWAQSSDNIVFFEVDRTLAQLKSFNHLFVDETTLGSESYKSIIKAIQTFMS